MSLPRFRHSSISLPTTLKKYKGNHSTDACRHIQKAAAIARANMQHDHELLATKQQTQPMMVVASTSSYSASASASCDKMLQRRDTNESEEDACPLESVIVSSEHDLENLEKHLN